MHTEHLFPVSTAVPMLTAMSDKFLTLNKLYTNNKSTELFSNKILLNVDSNIV